MDGTGEHTDRAYFIVPILGLCGTRCMSKYAVIAGGGVKVNFATGCMCRLKQMNSPVLHDLDVVSGVSAGGILASAISADQDIQKYYNKFASTAFVHPTNKCVVVSRALSMYTGHRQAFYNSEELTSTLHELVGNKRVTSANMLRVHAVDTATGNQHPFNMARDTMVEIKPIVASCSIAGLFPPVKLHGKTFVDGGMTTSVFPMLDIHDGVQKPHVKTMLICACEPWMGKGLVQASTLTEQFKGIATNLLPLYRHGLKELDHWHLMEMLDIEHGAVPDGRFMALYKRHPHGLELLQLMQPGHKRNPGIRQDLAVMFFAPTVTEYDNAESINLTDEPDVRRSTTDAMMAKGKTAAAEINMLADEIGLGWKRNLSFT